MTYVRIFLYISWLWFMLYIMKRHYKHSEHRKRYTDTVPAVTQLPRSRKWQSENNWTCNMY